MIETVEQAVKKLNEVRWRDAWDWRVCPPYLFANRPYVGSATRLEVMEDYEAIRIARSYELEEENKILRAELKQVNADFFTLNDICRSSQNEASLTLDMMDDCYDTLVPNKDIPPAYFWRSIASKIEELKRGDEMYAKRIVELESENALLKADLRRLQNYNSWPNHQTEGF